MLILLSGIHLLQKLMLYLFFMMQMAFQIINFNLFYLCFIDSIRSKTYFIPPNYTIHKNKNKNKKKLPDISAAQSPRWICMCKCYYVNKLKKKEKIEREKERVMFHLSWCIDDGRNSIWNSKIYMVQN